MLDLIFVYGSLVSAIAHPQGERLRREADLLGPATLPARLYRVSWYPAIVKSEEPGDLVHGEVYRLRTPDSTLAWLDEYEGITRGATSVTSPNEYERVAAAVDLAAGGNFDAWVYLYLRPTAALERVASGRWSG
jgi:gamma-glutamylcyclotransferase (GGCT)/AIG2-like uncharacterized protein YtfP